MKALNFSGGAESASEQPASRSGNNTVRCGLRILAVSAMKCTPAKEDHVGLGTVGRLSQSEAITHEVREFLDLR
jgi:hypothetical protein